MSNTRDHCALLFLPQGSYHFSVGHAMFFCCFFFLCTGVVYASNMFGLSCGAVVSCTNRFVRRVRRLADKQIVWPDAERRKELADYAWSTFGFRGCIGSVDGTTVPLAYAPSYQPWTFWDRHDRYSMHLLLACDHDRTILSVTLGFTGAAGDPLVQRHAEWQRQPGRHFAPLEYLLGDKGMHRTARVVCPYKGNAALTTENVNFNFQLARLRVIAEHVIGILKGRWMSLLGLRCQITTEKDFKAAMDWIIACCVLHNICNSVGDDDAEVVDGTSDSTEDVSPASQTAEETRERVKQDVLAFMRATGEFKG